MRLLILFNNSKLSLTPFAALWPTSLSVSASKFLPILLTLSFRYECNFYFIIQYFRYPLEVHSDGRVTEMPNIPNIPDFGLPTVGGDSYIPANVTT